MKAKVKYRVVPNLPIELEILGRLAHNVCFSWKEDIRDLFQRIDPLLWPDCEQDPVLMLGLVSQDWLSELSLDHGFLRQLEQVRQGFERYLTQARRSCDQSPERPTQENPS